MIRRILAIVVAFFGSLAHVFLTIGGVEFFKEILTDEGFFRREFLALAWVMSFFWPFIAWFSLNAETVNKLNENIRLARKVEDLEREIRERKADG